MMRFSALQALQFTLRSVRARCGRGARFALFLSASALAHAAPDAQVPLDRPGAAAVAGGAPTEGASGRRDWRHTLDGQSAESLDAQQRRRISREERDHLRKHVRDAARDAYREAPKGGKQSGRKGR